MNTITEIEWNNRYVFSDVIDFGYKVKSSHLSEHLEALRRRNRKRHLPFLRLLVIRLYRDRGMLRLIEKTCCFTGHRDIPSDAYKLIFNKAEKAVESLIKKGYLYFGAGGALGFDTIAALVVLKLKKRYPDIRLILVLPCLSQTRGWQNKDIEIYENIKQQADKVVYTSKEYTKGCMHKRNRHLVDNSSACIAYLTESRGGTAYTVDYAVKHGLDVFNIAYFL